MKKGPWFWRDRNAEPLRGVRLDITHTRGNVTHSMDIAFSTFPPDADPAVMLEIIDALASGLRDRDIEVEVRVERWERR